MAHFQRVLIIGTGFMGNALAHALHDNQAAKEIFGVEPNPTFRSRALENNCYQQIWDSIDSISDPPTLAIIASPIETVVPIASQLLEKFAETLVSDIASVKNPIVEQAVKLEKPFQERFVPAHPITGSDRIGPIRPPSSIFTNRSCVITPLESNSSESIQAISKLWESVGSEVCYLSPHEHDELLGMTSHMPHAVASALSAALTETELKYCGTGIRDTIRIAKSNPLLWKQIFVQNRVAVLEAMNRFQAFFDKLRHSLETDSIDDLVSILEQGQKNRDALGN